LHLGALPNTCPHNPLVGGLLSYRTTNKPYQSRSRDVVAEACAQEGVGNPNRVRQVLRDPDEFVADSIGGFLQQTTEQTGIRIERYFVLQAEPSE